MNSDAHCLFRDYVGTCACVVCVAPFALRWGRFHASEFPRRAARELLKSPVGFAASEFPHELRRRQNMNALPPKSLTHILPTTLSQRREVLRRGHFFLAYFFFASHSTDSIRWRDLLTSSHAVRHESRIVTRQPSTY